MLYFIFDPQDHDKSELLILWQNQHASSYNHRAGGGVEGC